MKISSISSDQADGDKTEHNAYYIDIDDKNGMICAYFSTFASIEQADQYREEMVLAIETVRERFGKVRALIDISHTVAQSPEVASKISRNSGEPYREGDRVALVAASSLVKMQMRRVLDPRFHEFFLSSDAAKMWLWA